MVRHTSNFYFLLLSIFAVILQLEYISSKDIQSDGEDEFKSNDFLSPKKQQSSNVAGFDLSKDEIKKFKIWPDGFIPYYIDVTSFSDKVLRDKIRSFLNMVNGITPLNFVELPSPPADDQTRWVFFINRQGLSTCADHSVWDFNNEGVQRVILGYDCMNKEGELAQAVLAIAGVPAQHTAPNRDDHIEVFVNNIMPEKRKLFEKLTDSDWLFHDLPYDYDSVGHYHNFKYSMNGKTVIQPRNPNVNIGETKELSKIDIMKIKLLYNFITQKKQLDVPVCQKLFKLGSKFKSFVPVQINAQPQQKPYKYTGVQNKENNSGEYTDYSDQSNLFTDTDRDHEELSNEKFQNDASLSDPRSEYLALNSKKKGKGKEKYFTGKKLTAPEGEKKQSESNQKKKPKTKLDASEGKKRKGGKKQKKNHKTKLSASKEMKGKQKTKPKTKSSASGGKKIKGGSNQVKHDKSKLSALEPTTVSAKGGKKRKGGSKQKKYRKTKVAAMGGKAGYSGAVSFLQSPINDSLPYSSDSRSDNEDEERKKRVLKEKRETLKLIVP